MVPYRQSFVSLILDFVGFGGLAASWIFLAHVTDILKAFEHIEGFGFGDAKGHNIFLFLETAFDISIDKEFVGIIFDFSGNFVIFKIDLTGRNDLKWEALLFKVPIKVGLVSWTCASHYCLKDFYYFNYISQV